LIDPTELFPEIPNIYDFPSIHAGMLYDNERVEKYKSAIKEIIKPGDVVADIGTGTGLLAFLCLKAGAKKVHAIERTSAIEWAKKIADKNGLSDKIEFYNADSLDCELGEKVDVIISELIGHIAFEEGMAESLFDAKERFLLPNGIMIPEKVELKIALVEDSQVYSDCIDCWDYIEGIDFSPIRNEAVNACYLVDLKSHYLLSKPTTFIEVNFENVGRFIQFLEDQDFELNKEDLIKEIEAYCVNLKSIPLKSREFFISVLKFASSYGQLDNCINCIKSPYIDVQDTLELDHEEMLARIKNLERFNLLNYDEFDPCEDGQIVIGVIGSEIDDDFNLSFEIREFLQNDINKLKSFFIDLTFNELD